MAKRVKSTDIDSDNESKKVSDLLDDDDGDTTTQTSNTPQEDDSENSNVLDAFSPNNLYKDFQNTKLFKKAQDLNAEYDRRHEEAFDIFYARGYEEPPEPDEERVEYFTNDNGEVLLDEDGSPLVSYVEPEVLSKWRCEYYYPPEIQARLFRAIVFYAILLIFAIAAGFSYGFIFIFAALVLLVLLSCAGRLYRFAFNFRPIPDIPFITPTSVHMYALDQWNLKHAQKEAQGDKSASYGGAKPSEVEYVTPVNVVIDGVESPATILARWMNGVQKWDEEDLSEASNGRLQVFVVKLLLTDDPEPWHDSGTIDALSEATHADNSDWINAVKAFDKAKEKEDS